MTPETITESPFSLHIPCNCGCVETIILSKPQEKEYCKNIHFHHISKLKCEYNEVSGLMINYFPYGSNLSFFRIQRPNVGGVLVLKELGLIINIGFSPRVNIDVWKN